jgi:hypothetical protein
MTSRENSRPLLVAVAVVALLVVAVPVASLMRLDSRLTDAETNTALLGAAYDAARNTGPIPDAPTAEEIIDGEPVPGPQGEPGRGPTASEVAAAVRAYLEANPPAPGQAVTDAQVAIAVASYCATGACQGEDGTDGISGSDGASGAAGADGAPGAAGEAGRAPTPEEITAAVSAYCDANNGCVGPTGPPGPGIILGDECFPAYTWQERLVLLDTFIVCAPTP